MGDLESVVRENGQNLREAFDNLRRLSSSHPKKLCIPALERHALLYKVLDGTAQLFETRRKSWDVVLRLCDRAPLPEKRNTVEFGGEDMDFSIARHLALASYQTTTWAIFDRLANSCGRMVFGPELANNLGSNPKLCEHLLAFGKKKAPEVGFGWQSHLKILYAWPTFVSYKIRNWLGHEGYEDGSVDLFEGNLWRDQLLISATASKKIESAIPCSSSEHSCLDTHEDTWRIDRESNNCNDLKEVLPQYNSQVDEMFCTIVPWSVGALTLQLRCRFHS